MHFSVVIFILYQIFDSASGQGRIYGGNRIKITDAPYMAFVEYLEENGEYVDDCGGSILTKNLILTAGHCTVDDDTGKQNVANRFTVRVGSTYNYRGGQVHKVKKVFTHPKYVGDHHDVGILQLTDDIQFSKTAQPVQLADPDDKICVGADTVISGWGENPDHPRDESHLYQVHLRVANATICASLYGDTNDFGKDELCLQGVNKSDCEGDSGGPLIYVKTGKQIGIVSYGAEDCVSNAPTVYSKIQDNFDFINDVKQQTGNKDETDKPHC